MNTPLMLIVAIALVIGALWYLVRFSREVRKIKREIRKIQQSGHAKSALRRMRRQSRTGGQRTK